MKNKLRLLLSFVVLVSFSAHARECLLQTDLSSNYEGISKINTDGNILGDENLLLVNHYGAEDGPICPGIGYGNIGSSLTGIVELNFTLNVDRGSIRSYVYVTDSEQDTILQMMIGDEGANGGNKIFIVTDHVVSYPSGHGVAEELILLGYHSKNTDQLFSLVINTETNTYSVSRNGVDYPLGQNIPLMKENVADVNQFIFVTGAGYGNDETNFYLDDLSLVSNYLPLKKAIADAYAVIDSVTNTDEIVKDAYLLSKIEDLDLAISNAEVIYNTCGSIQSDEDSVIIALAQSKTVLLDFVSTSLALNCDNLVDLDFETMDSIPDTWTELSTVGQVTIDTAAIAGSDRSLCIDFTLDQPGVIIPFDQCMHSNGDISFDFSSQRNTLRSYVLLLDSNDNVVSELMIGNFATTGTNGNDGGAIYLLNQEVASPDGRPTDDQKIKVSTNGASNSAWRTIRLSLDFDNKTIAGSVDDDMLDDAAAVPFIKSDADHIAKIKIVLGRMYGDESTIDNIYFDHIIVSEEKNTFDIQTAIYDAKYLRDSVAEIDHSNIAPYKIELNSAIDAATSALSCTASDADFLLAISNLQSAETNVRANLSDATSGIETISLAMQVYPNPTTGLITLSANVDLSQASYQIVALTGQVVADGCLDSNTLDLSQLNKGLYILNVKQGDRHVFTNLIIQ